MSSSHLRREYQTRSLHLVYITHTREVEGYGGEMYVLEPGHGLTHGGQDYTDLRTWAEHYGSEIKDK